ncbi:restriction endonuclease subunit S [Haemophilus parahaemolyticus]|uniref:Restriction endonuclease subunit S n=1 Tax=Haemophilus parahaemolyticus TaxID=735 RepID=A0A369ZHG3_HAEPH|nr:restriction endonuclease subunit S [Haemophilus parahaemolyticus]RDF04000.1 restriction endonuclease subunit S [Haemophilus parahaemolyticus]
MFLPFIFNTITWEQRKLGELGYCQSGIGFPELEQGGKTGIPFYKVSDMNLLGNEIFMENSNNYVSINQITNKKWKTITSTPAVIFAKVGAALMLDRKRLVLNEFLIDNNTMAYIFDDSWHYYFGKTLFDKTYLPQLSQTGALPSFNAKDVEELNVILPTSKEEQTQIGNFFKQLDDTIALHQRELEKFKILKTSYLEHIFLGKVSLFTAKNTITWEQRKAEDVFISISEKNHETFPVLSATQNKGMISRNDVGIDIKYDVNSLKTYKLVRKDQFVIHLRSFQGGFAHSAIDGITSPAYTILDFKDKRIHSPLFWREIFKSDFFIKRLESVIYGIRDGRSINYDEFLKLNFNYPSFEEQTQIGNFFKQLDDTIALHQKELAKYQQIKAACLEKMFVE